MTSGSTAELADLPLRPELRGEVPYGAPQLDVAHRLNVNENPYPPSAEMLAEVARAVQTAGVDLNRYPDRVATALRAAGLAPLLDDRDERAGAKFADADLLGVPYRVTLGRTLERGEVELKDRRTGETLTLPLEEVAGWLSARFRERATRAG